MEGGDARLRYRAREHAKHGTTSLLATTMTASRDEFMEEVVAGLGEQAKAAPRAARACSACISKVRTSIPASSARSRTPSAVAGRNEVLKYLLAPIRVVTIAPEISGHFDTISEMASRGVRV